MNVMSDQAFARFARGLFLCGSLSLLSQDVDCAFEISLCFHQRRAAVGKSRAGAFAQLLHELRWNTHSLCWVRHGFMNSFVGKFSSVARGLRLRGCERETSSLF